MFLTALFMSVLALCSYGGRGSAEIWSVDVHENLVVIRINRSTFKYLGDGF